MTAKKLTLTLLVAGAAIAAHSQTVDATSETTPLNHYWQVGTCAGRANEGLRTSWVEQLRTSKENCGFCYLRMHGLFDDDMFVYFEDAHGNPIYNWQYVDEVYDRMLALGVRPFVELSFFPKGIAADDSKMQMWYQNRVTYDPTRLHKWAGLVHAFTQHVVDRYGLDEVRNWYFEVWNEPNLNMNPRAGFFDGSKSDYFAMYKASAQAVKSVDKSLKIGGPATSNFIADTRFDGEVYDQSKSRFYTQDKINKQQWKGSWIEDFVRYCERESLPVDFISTHPYPTDYALDPESGKSKDAVRYVHSLKDDINWLRSILASSKYPNAEIHLTEWSTSPNSRDAMHDLLPPAAYIIKCNLDCHGLANSLMYWTFTDIFEEKGGGDNPFHGGFGMINFQGIVKPSFHAYRMLNNLGDETILYSEPIIVTRHSDTGKITALAFNYPEEYVNAVPSAANKDNFMAASAKKLTSSIVGLKPHAKFVVETLDNEHGNAYNDYKAIGAPRHLSIQQTQYLRDKAWATDKVIVEADDDGCLVLDRELSPWSCVLINEI